MNSLRQVVFLVNIFKLVSDFVIFVFVPVKVHRACFVLFQRHVGVEHHADVLLGLGTLYSAPYLCFLLYCQLLLDRILILELDVFELH